MVGNFYYMAENSHYMAGNSRYNARDCHKLRCIKEKYTVIGMQWCASKCLEVLYLVHVGGSTTGSIATGST